MIILDSAVKILQAVLAGAITTSQPQCNVVFSDENQSGDDTKYASKQTNTNSTTDVDICSAPQQSFTRNIEYISIYNLDTASVTVTVKIDISGVETILIKATLATLESLHYDTQGGWYAMTAAGARK